MPFLSGLYANYTAGGNADLALRSSRTDVHNRPAFVFLLRQQHLHGGIIGMEFTVGHYIVLKRLFQR